MRLHPLASDGQNRTPAVGERDVRDDGDLARMSVLYTTCQREHLAPSTSGYRAVDVRSEPVPALEPSGLNREGAELGSAVTNFHAIVANANSDASTPHSQLSGPASPCGLGVSSFSEAPLCSAPRFGRSRP